MQLREPPEQKNSPEAAPFPLGCGPHCGTRLHSPIKAWEDSALMGGTSRRKLPGWTGDSSASGPVLGPTGCSPLRRPVGAGCTGLSGPAWRLHPLLLGGQGESRHAGGLAVPAPEPNPGSLTWPREASAPPRKGGSPARRPGGAECCWVEPVSRPSQGHHKGEAPGHRVRTQPGPHRCVRQSTNSVQLGSEAS